MGFLKRVLKGRESDLHQAYLPPERVQKRVRTEGITFKLELIKAEAVDSGLSGCVEIARDIGRKKLDERSGDAVLFTVAPTRIHVVRRNPWAIYCDHLMDNMELCCSSKQDPRLLLVTAIDEHTGVLMCYAFRTQKRCQVTAQKICGIIQYACSYWREIKEPEHPDYVALRSKHGHWNRLTREDSCTKAETCIHLIKVASSDGKMCMMSCS